MPSKKAAQIKLKFVQITKDCKYSHGVNVRSFKQGEKLFVDPKLKGGFETDKPFISERFKRVLEFNKHI